MVSLPPTVALSRSLSPSEGERLSAALSHLGSRVTRTAEARAVCVPATPDWVVKCLGRKKLPILVGERVPMRGYDLYPLGDSGFLADVWVPRRREYDDLALVTDPGDWPVPVPNESSKWHPRCYVPVASLERMPLWLLCDPSRVFLGGPEAKIYMNDLELKGRGVRSVPVPGAEGSVDHVPVKVFTRKPLKTFLTGPEILARLPRKGSVMMSVAGWPLRYVPIRYLDFLASRGQLPRKLSDLDGLIRARDSVRSGTDEVFEYGPPRFVETEAYHFTPRGLRVVTLRHVVFGRYRTLNESFRGRDPRADPFTRCLHKYLSSCEGRERLRAAGLLDEGWALDIEEEVPWREDQEALRGIKGTWVGRNVGGREEYRELDDWDQFFHPDSAKVSLVVRCVSGNDRFLRCGRKAEALRSLGRRKAELLLDRRNRLLGDREVAWEAFSCSDRDRFGPWGSSPPARWLPSGRPGSFSQKVASAEEDPDPLPGDVTLTGKSEWAGRRLTREPEWTSGWQEEPPKDWSPPSLPDNPVEAEERGWRLLTRLEQVTTLWDRDNHKSSWHSRGKKDRWLDAHQRDEDRELLLSQVDFWERQCWALLPENHPLEGLLREGVGEALRALSGETRWEKEEEETIRLTSLVDALALGFRDLALPVFRFYFPGDREKGERRRERLKKREEWVERSVRECLDHQGLGEKEVPVAVIGGDW